MSVASDIKTDGLSEDAILDLYREAQKELFAIIQSGDPSKPFGTYRRQQFAAIERVIHRLERESGKFAEKAIPRIYKAGDKETLERIRSFKERSFSVEFGGVNEDAIEILTGEAHNEFARTMRGLRESATAAVINKARVQNEIIKGAIQGSSFTRTQRGVETALREQGFTVLKSRNGFGRKFSLEAYSNMIVRSQNVKAYNTGAKGRLLGMGRRFGIFPTIRPDIDGDDICNRWEEKKYVDLLKDPLPPESTHPNCRHTIQPVSMEQLQAERPDLFELEMQYFEKTTGFRPQV